MTLNSVNLKPFTVILGQDWLERRNPIFDWHTKTMPLTRLHKSGKSTRTIVSRAEKALEDDSPDTEWVSANTMRKHLRRMKYSKSADFAAFLCHITLQNEEVVMAAADSPDDKVTIIRQSIMEDFDDIMKEDIPPGIPPARFEGDQGYSYRF
ncbi:hypothetical protein CYMTET_55839 [Cymbomonas tetramitiformis]|uniref:Uncharacterized protein n=1 Tax=Cymbomonas tetramitiformis TaxID=36881 RepID=A0AAE0EPC5_9CHLO|nr:hypothetical protein CYMTET_55839 [Cymbomonas tetramitiformis]|eukprot:gene6129-biopygen6161